MYNEFEEYSLNTKMNVEHPTGTGSFSLNRRPDSVVGDFSVTVGFMNEATGNVSYAEGMGNFSEGMATHAEGSGTSAIGDYSHAEGRMSMAEGLCAHAEGYHTEARMDYSHTEGYETIASGEKSHAEGEHAHTYGVGSHAEGLYTSASGDYSHAQGKFNVEDSQKIYAHIVGNGDSVTHSNAHTLDWSGNAWFSGDVYVGSASGTNKDDGSKKLATEDHVAEAITAVVGDTTVSEQINTAVAAIPTPTFSVTDDGNGNVTIMLG